MKLDAQRGTRIHAYICVSTYMVFHRRVHFVPRDVVFHNEWFCGPGVVTVGKSGSGILGVWKTEVP